MSSTQELTLPAPTETAETIKAILINHDARVRLGRWMTVNELAGIVAELDEYTLDIDEDTEARLVAENLADALQLLLHADAIAHRVTDDQTESIAL